MTNFSAEAFAATLALVGVVILISALLSGVIEKTGLPQVAIFIALGAALGPAGLNILNVGLDSPEIRVVATLSLALVLFSDAVTLDIGEVRKNWNLAVLVLGPGTLLSAALFGLAGWFLLGLSPAMAAIFGAALASTDPVLLRGLLRRRDVPGTAKQALRLESGLNDVVLLPVVLVAMAFEGHNSPTDALGWAKLALDLGLLGPGAGVAVGLIAVSTMDLVRRRIGMRRDYESLYSLAVAFTAFAAAEAVHGSGFLAAFAAGLTIAAFDVELCDCFLEYGEATAEMLLLFTFVLFGGSLIWSGFSFLSWQLLVFAGLVIFARPVIFRLSLAKANLETRSRRLISWFGPRGLSSLLLVLLPVFDGVIGADRLFALCSFVVLVSVVIHGGSPMLLSRAPKPRPPAPPLEGKKPLRQLTVLPEPISTPAQIEPAPDSEAVPVRGIETVEAPSPRPSTNGEQAPFNTADPIRITLAELRELWKRGEQVIMVDSRSFRSYDASDMEIQGAVRISPDFAPRDATEKGFPKEAWLALFCT